ncbi:hypothetical protein AN640_02470 [Candidatus Epulonipiscium fishelsonii]|uniref:Uncharacterized protein n=1 Tax=Candidatus Epulonipiscium fishelsonii TaxID=77094 RepID=A0ACC8X910_9FIRM|nr:hypothetical protein AN640_02470 [Epulopiscium sp. SCG-D08WGA-EpuloA1]
MIFKSELEDALGKWYKVSTGRDMDFQNPQTFNEKIQWCKLYDNNPLKTKLTDKQGVRKWVADKIGKEYLINIFGVYENWDGINFENLPQQFVIKTTHGCNQSIIIKNKNNFDKTEAKLQIENWLNYNYYLNSMEMQYKDIKPHILIEEYLKTLDNQLCTYKFWCFNGKVEYIVFQPDTYNDSNLILFNKNWEKQDFISNIEEQNCEIKKPENLDKMINVAETLSNGFVFASIDLYRLDNKNIKFNKIEFTPYSGECKWNNIDTDFKIGQLFNIEPLKEKLINQYNNSKVIFFTPVYNAIDTIERAYKSLVNQTDKNWIWHVVDDVSTDGTYELLQKFANKDERIILHRNKINNVVAEGNDIVDIGIMYNDIDYLAILDADDEYTSDFIIECKTYAVANNLDIVAGGREIIVDNKHEGIKVAKKQFLILTKTEKEELFIEYFSFMINYWGKLFKISNLKIIDRSNLIYQHNNGHDTAFSTELCRNAKNIGILNKLFYKYYIYKTSKSHTWRKGKIDSYIKIHNLMKRYLLDCNLIITETNKNAILYNFICLTDLSAKILILESNLTDYKKQQEILKIGRADYIKCLIEDEGFNSWCNNRGIRKDVKKECFTLIKTWILSQTNIADDIVLEFCEIGQLFCSSINDEEGWTKFSILHANALTELGNNMITQGEQEIQELERMLSL